MFLIGSGLASFNVANCIGQLIHGGLVYGGSTTAAFQISNSAFSDLTEAGASKWSRRLRWLKVDPAADAIASNAATSTLIVYGSSFTRTSYYAAVFVVGAGSTTITASTFQSCTSTGGGSGTIVPLQSVGHLKQVYSFRVAIPTSREAHSRTCTV